MNYFIIIARKLFTFLLVLSAIFQLLASPVALAYENAVENATVIIVVAQSISEDKERNKAFQNGKVLKVALEKRLILFTCGNGAKHYPGTKDPKLLAWVLTKQAECAGFENKFDTAKAKLRKAKLTYTDNLESRYLFLQIEFQQGLYDDFVTNFEELIDAVTDGKWPTLTSAGLLLDPHFVIQELRQRLTPNLFTLLEAAYAVNNSELDKKILGVIEYINTKGRCTKILSDVLNRIDDYNDLLRSEHNEKAINSKNLKIYTAFSKEVAAKACPKLDKIEASIK